MYVGMLQTRFRALGFAASKRELKANRLRKIDKLAADVASSGDAADVLVALIELRAAIKEWTKDIPDNFSDRLRDAVAGASEQIRVESIRLGVSSMDESMSDGE